MSPKTARYQLTKGALSSLKSMLHSVHDPHGSFEPRFALRSAFSHCFEPFDLNGLFAAFDNKRPCSHATTAGTLKVSAAPLLRHVRAIAEIFASVATTRLGDNNRFAELMIGTDDTMKVPSLERAIRQPSDRRDRSRARRRASASDPIVE